MRKIDSCGKELTRWSRYHFRLIRKELEKKRRDLSWQERIALQGGCATRLLVLEKEIKSLLDKEECMWRQRSKTVYMKEGDRNTRFFHCRATMRKRKNTITGIKDGSDQWCTEADQIASIFEDYYKELFISVNPESVPTALSSIP